MKITFVTVSPPAVKLLPRAVNEICALSEGAADLRLYYATEEFSTEKTAALMGDIADSDAVFLDLMGAPPTVVSAVSRGCENCRGNIIPYGASSREYLRLGDFSAQSMKNGGRKSGGKAPVTMESMKKMQTAAEAVGKILPGKMRDMRNYSLLMKYFQNAVYQNLYNLLLLLLSEYGKVKGLPKAAPPKLTPPIALYDTEDMTPFSDMGVYEAAMGFDGSRPAVALLFTAYTYPTDTAPCVKAITKALSAFCDVYPIGICESFQEISATLRTYLTGARGGIALVLDCAPFRLAAGPMGGNGEDGISLLDEVGASFLHPFFLTRRTGQEWRESVRGCSPNEVLISLMLPELDGAIETIPVAAMSEPVHNDDYDVDEYLLEPLPDRLERLAARVRRHLSLRKKKNNEKRVAILCYNYPPGEANLFGGAFLDTFESVSAILTRLKQEGYDTNALSAEELMDIFTAGKAVNSGRYDTDWEEEIHYPAKACPADPEITEAWGASPGTIMAENGAFRIPGTCQGKVFVGLQPSRGYHESDDKAYHDKTVPPHHQYAAFYQWLREEFKADVILHVGTHGTLEFLKGKECGMSAACWPDRLVEDLPHIYLYYCGNPSEAVIAKRRSHANLVSYQPPVFVESELYGDWLTLSTAIENYHHLEAVSPAGAAAALEELQTRAAALGLSSDLDEMEGELYRMNHSLIPKGLHIFGTGYTPEELHSYEDGLAALRADGEEITPEIRRKARADAGRAAENHEMEGLLRVLRDQYNPPRLAGDIYRNPEVLPAGHNLYQFDSRLVPSETAMKRGHDICEATLKAYYDEHGGYPNSIAVIAWGLEASRTQGETVGQILAYLGVRLAADSHVWDRKFEIIPPEELGRPRIDVTINICGFFRDMFGSLIDGIDDLLEQLYELNETDEENYFRANTRRRYRTLLDQGYDPEEARQLAAARIFGPQEGEYGTGLTTIVETSSWEDEAQLGTAFTASLRYLYTRRMSGRDVKGLYADNLKCVDIVSQVRCSNEYEITDLDHYYEFFGGLAKSVELAKGAKASMYITDTTGSRILTETVDKSIARGLRTRVLNPKWIDGMLEHKYHGAQKISDRFENVMGLAATTGAVDQSLYNDLEAKYVQDEDTRRRMAENNPHAYMEILEQMMEYQSRGYWDASEEQLRRIRKTYLELENSLEETI